MFMTFGESINADRTVVDVMLKTLHILVRQVEMDECLRVAALYVPRRILYAPQYHRATTKFYHMKRERE